MTDKDIVGVTQKVRVEGHEEEATKEKGVKSDIQLHHTPPFVCLHEAFDCMRISSSVELHLQLLTQTQHQLATDLCYAGIVSQYHPRHDRPQHWLSGG
jgi:hypothetical protein